ncbi:nuclear transport factor 2 family protein [Dietzia sp. ANT_WB102]|uniref:nuclear transport factor 2 family protein n=1 Tax=Dietzia sp. ANT_WB102 TaxID=2597345 RepID=UPI00165DB41E|nr:nuclear transport factor 2 family protein [Dietzia sp. ANT_WB102]
MPRHETALTTNDRIETLSLTSRYAHALDRRTRDRLESAFLPDAIMEFVGIPATTGPTEIVGVCAGALAPLESSQHLASSPLLEVTEDGVTVSSHFHAPHVRNEAPGLFTVA